METRLKCGHTLQLRHLPRLCPFMSSSPKTEIVAEVACIKSSNDIFAKLALVKSDVFFPFDRISGFTRSFFLAFCSSSHLRAQLKLSESFWSYRKVSSPLGTSSTLSLLSFSFSSSRCAVVEGPHFTSRFVLCSPSLYLFELKRVKKFDRFS